MYLPRLLLAIWHVGLLGVAAELVLLEHYEDALQLAPFGAIAAGIAVGTWLALRPGRVATHAFRAVLALFLLSGLVGLVLHYRGNAEFERERDPTIGGLKLLWESLGGATPALAPGTMILFAFIGYAVLVSEAAAGRLTLANQRPRRTLDSSVNSTSERTHP